MDFTRRNWFAAIVAAVAAPQVIAASTTPAAAIAPAIQSARFSERYIIRHALLAVGALIPGEEPSVPVFNVCLEALREIREDAKSPHPIGAWIWLLSARIGPMFDPTYGFSLPFNGPEEWTVRIAS